MWYSLLADLLVTIHVGYVAYVVVGLVLILVGLGRGWGWVRHPWFRLSHFAAILVVVFELIFKLRCPLTVWEMQLRSLAGQPGNEATFVGQLMHYFLFSAVPAWMSNTLYISVALIIAVTFVLGPPRWTLQNNRPDAEAQRQR